MKFIFLSILFFFQVFLFQKIYPQKYIKIFKEDTASVNRVNEKFSEMLQSNTDSAFQMIERTLAVARKLDYKKGTGASLNNMGLAYYKKGDYKKALEHYLEAVSVLEEIKYIEKLSVTLANIGNIFNAQSNFPRALEYYKSSLKYARIVKDEKRTASLLGNIGIIFYNMGSYSQALDYYMQSLNIRQNLGDKKGIAFVYTNIGIIYDDQKNYKKSLEHYNKALEIRKELKDQNGIASCLINMGVSYSNLGDNEKALECFTQSYEIAKETDFKTGIASALNNIGDVFHKKGNLEKSLEYYLKTEDIYNTIRDDKGLTVTWINLGNIYKEKGKLDEAAKLYQKALDLSQKAGFRDISRNIFRYMADLYFKKTNYQQAYQYFNRYADLHDSLTSQSSLSQIADMQVKYEVAQKENEIHLLKKEKQLQSLQVKEKQYLIYALLGLFLFIIILIWISFKSYKHKQLSKQLLVQQKADQMMRDAEKKLLNKVIETEENERKRFAKDLHDGLGPLLSSIKLYVNELSVDRDKNEAEMVQYTSELIDDAINTTRLLANNLMPSILEDYGLIEAVRWFSDKVTFTGSVNIELTNNNSPLIANKTTEIILYRVVLELINNTIKHAGADTVKIEFSGQNDLFCILYNDNGSGFDVDATLKSIEKGLGLSNIVHRINSINGLCKINSKPGEGMTVEIAVPRHG